MEYEFFTEYKASIGLQKLEEAIRTEHIPFLSLPHTSRSKPILGKVKENTFRLRKGSLVNNQFAPLFYGEIVDQKNGALIRGRFKPVLFYRVFFMIWFWGIIAAGSFMSVVGFIDVFTGSQIVKSQNPWTAALAPLGFIALVLIAMHGFRKWGERDRHFILKFLETTFRSRPESTQSDRD